MTHSLLGTDSIKGFRTGSEMKTVLTGSQSRMTLSPREHLVMSRGKLGSYNLEILVSRGQGCCCLWYPGYSTHVKN